MCVVRVCFSFQGGKERGCVYKRRMSLMTLLSQRKKKQERKTLYFCFSISILLCFAKVSCKRIPLLGKDKDDFSLPLFSFLLETVLCQICRCGYEIFNRFPFSDYNEDSDTSHPFLSPSATSFTHLHFSSLH